MSEDKSFDFSVEVDPNYVRQKRNDPALQKQPAQIMTTRAWVMSLLLPVLSILASVFFVVFVMIPSGFPSFVFTAVLGLICGGVVPTVMIVRGKLDTSKFFIGKMILIAAAVGIWFLFNYTELEYWIFDILGGFTYQIVIVLAEIIFAAVQKTNIKTKICLALSSLGWGFLGFSLDFVLGWIYF